MAILKGLSGINEQERECVFIKNKSDIPKILKRGLAATCAHTNGAINIWKDDLGCIRTEVFKNLSCVEFFVHRNTKSVLSWYSVWLKKIK